MGGKVAVVTGAARGIGAAIARRFAADGARVIVADIAEQAGRATAAVIGGDYAPVDVADWPSVEALVAGVAAAHGRLDVLVNNAGVSGAGLVPDLPVADWRRVLAIDLDSVFYGCKAVIPVMRAQGGGIIINMGSISGLFGDHTAAAYNAAKGGVVNLTRSLAIDHIAEGIRINAICPGPIDTDILALAKTVPSLIEAWHRASPMGRFGTADEVAGVAAFLASDDARHVVGAALVVDGGMTAATGQPNFLRLVREAGLLP